MPILLTTIVLSGFGFGLVLPGFLFAAENLGASAWVATGIVGLFSVGQFISTTIWGRLSDRFGRKPMLAISLAGQAASYLLLGLATELWVMALARLLNGLTSGNLSVAMAYIADVTPAEKRAAGMGYVGGAISLGFIVGPMVGGLLGGADAESASLLWPGLAASLVCFLTFLATLVFLKESLPPEKRVREGDSAQPGGLQAVRHVLGRPIVSRMILVGFLVYFAQALFETVFPFWSEAQFDWGPREVGYSFTYLGLLVGLVQGVLVGRLVPLFGEGRLVVSGLVSYIVGLMIMIQAPTWPVMMFGITFTAGGGAMFVTTMSSLISRQAGPTEQGLVMGVYQSGSWMGRSIGPVSSGLLFEVGVHWPLLAAAIILLPALATLAGILSRLRDTSGEAVK